VYENKLGYATYGVRVSGNERPPAVTVWHVASTSGPTTSANAAESDPPAKRPRAADEPGHSRGESPLLSAQAAGLGRVQQTVGKMMPSHSGKPR
jgi:hypothetical protein